MEENKKKHYKTMTKVMHIITKLARIFMIVGVVGLLIGLIVVPIVGSTIKINTDAQTIRVLDENFNYEREAGKINILHGDEKTVISGDDEVKAFDLVLDYLGDSKLQKAIIVVELILVFAIAALVLNYIALRYLDKVFVGLSTDNTPFTSEHPRNFRMAGNYLVAVLITQVVGGGIIELIADNDFSSNFEYTNIMVILALFTLAHIFEYGYKLQSSSDIKMIEE